MSDKTKHQKRVEMLMHAAKQALPQQPMLPDIGVRKLRASIILEEALETVRALGFAPMVQIPGNGGRVEAKIGDIEFSPHKHEADLIKIVDGCADVSVVTIGTLSACGVSDKAVLEAVDKNNLGKFGPGHSYREDGKLIKPPGYKPPDFAEVLREQGWKG